MSKERVIDNTNRADHASRLLRVVKALATQQLRVAYLRNQLSEWPVSVAVKVLEEVLQRASTGAAEARAAQVAVCGLVQDPRAEGLVLGLRRVVEDNSLSLLRQVLWRGLPGEGEPAESQGAEQEPRIPDYGTGRPLTLGERKSLARRPSRKLYEKLLLDPHPSVIQLLLSNPLTTEDDVVRLAARRPLRAEVIQEIARHSRWNVRARVRLALVLNPYTPSEIGVPLVRLLLRSELRQTVAGPETNEAIRAAARARLEQHKAKARGVS